MNYIRSLLGSMLLLLAITATLNFVIDPAHIYRESYISPDRYAEELFGSKSGLYVPKDGINERALAKSLIGFSKGVDCVVIGSSHVMPISSVRRPQAFADVCDSILNLGVSGASIEDHLVLASLSVKQGVAKKVVLGIAPWTFAFGKDRRWISYDADYKLANLTTHGISQEHVINNQYQLIVTQIDNFKFRNLINMEYTFQSMSTFVNYLKNGFPVITAVGSLDPLIGAEYPARLKDGSLVHSANYILAARNARVPSGGLVYKTDGKINQQDAIRAYRDALVWIKAQGVEPILLMTPYHENVWKAENSANVVAMRQTENVVSKLASDLNLKILGSYNPEVVGCLSTEFYDFMHPDGACLARIR